MTIPLRVLIIEDSEDDTLLLLRLLRSGGYEPASQRVDSEPDLRVALQDGEWDVVISDYRMPGFDGLAALQICQDAGLDVPFILVSGTIGEELAVTAMRNGAHDYLMKDKLARLVPAVQRELQEAEVRRSHKLAEDALRESEEKYRALFESAPEIIALLGLDGVILDVNDAIKTITGVSRAEVIGKVFSSLGIIPEDNIEDYLSLFSLLVSGQNIPPIEAPITHRNGEMRWLETQFALLMRGGQVWAIQVIALDITGRKLADEALRRYAERLRTLRELDQAILSARSPEQIARAALDQLRHMVPFAAAGVIMLDSQTLEATLFVADVDDRWALPAGMQFQMAQVEGIDGILAALRQGETVVFKDVAALARMQPALAGLAALDVKAVISVPLRVQDNLLGFIGMGGGQPDAFSEEQIEIVREVATQLAIAIQQAQLHEQIQRHARELEVRVAERTADLQAANARLEALGEVKDAFVSNVSHELRTPITSIKLYHHLLESRTDKTREYMAALNRETRRLESLIEGLLMLSRLDQQREDIAPAATNLNALVIDYVSDRGPLALKQGITLTAEVQEQVPEVRCDQRLIGQVLSILLTNALSYTPAGGRVVVSTLAQEDHGERWSGFCVRDTGPGIPAKEIDHLFQRFYRGAAGKKSNIPGTGLGLSIAREIVDRHSGRIEVSSDGRPGKGASFVVWLPVLAPVEDGAWPPINE